MIQQFFQDKQKVIIAVVAIILVIAAIIVIRRALRPKIHPGSNQIATQAQVELEISQSTQAQSYPNSQYAIWADQLEVAMQDAGTDEDVIFNIIGFMNNDKDVLKLVEAFGTRGYNGTAIWIPSWFRPQLSLGGFFAEELTVSELETINSKLASKGILYRF